jgi:hypothetical protein
MARELLICWPGSELVGANLSKMGVLEGRYLQNHV